VIGGRAGRKEQAEDGLPPWPRFRRCRRGARETVECDRLESMTQSRKPRSIGIGVAAAL